MKPIGIFDSGLGGLTVASAIHKLYPDEDLLYFGDTARVPYGTKSKDTVIRYATEIADFLATWPLKGLVIACNTATAHSLEILQKRYSFPVLGVIEPAVEMAIARSKNRRIGIIATKSTILSQKYQRLLEPKGFSVYAQPASVLVSIVEEGWHNEGFIEPIVHRYIDPLVEKQIDTLILGCTHFPLLVPIIYRLYPHLVYIDSAYAVAQALNPLIEVSPKNGQKGQIEIFVSDPSPSLENLTTLFFGKSLPVQAVSFDTLHKR